MTRNIMEIRWTELESMDKEKITVFLGFAPIEEHGRHLPLGVDVYETQYWMDHVIAALEGKCNDAIFLTLPVIPYGHAKMMGFPGNLHLTQELFYDLVHSTLQNVVEWGIKNIVVLSGHADPRHTIAIEQACEKIHEDYGVVAFAPMGAIFSKNILPDIIKDNQQVQKKMEQYTNDFHAGWIETSNMLMIRPDLVQDIYKEQPDIEMVDREMIDPMAVKDKIKGYGHIGYPKEAKKELGISLNQSTIKKIELCVWAYLNRSDYEQFEHHQLYQIQELRVKED